MRNYTGWLIACSFSWWMILIPFDYHVLGVILEPIHTLAYKLISSVASPVPFFSDSSGMYLLLLICPVLGALTAAVFLLPVFHRIREKGAEVTKTVLLYFLVLELWKYGWIKLIKLQFYLPEPNTVYSPLGDLSKDIAYWSVIGSSHSYVVFMGIAELLAGTMLLFKRTRFAGLLLALGIFVNVLMVNISFDISVKLFVIVTLLMIVVLLTGYPAHWRFLFGFDAKPVVKKKQTDLKRNRLLHALTISVFVTEAIYPSFAMEGMNDDAAVRPARHGAYCVSNHPSVNRFYVHRQEYVIFEDRSGKRLDLKVMTQSNDVFGLLDERNGQKSLLLWKSPGVVIWDHVPVADTFVVKPLPYRELPLMQPSFHWFSDSFH